MQRLKQLSEADAMAEGVREDAYGKNQARTPIVGFLLLWDSLNKKRGFGWDTNPWVVAISFDVFRQNVTTLTEGGE